MKKTSFILSLLLGLFVTTFALTACGGDDDDDNGGGGGSNSLVGTWIIKSVNDSDIWFPQITLKSDGSGIIPEDILESEELEDYYVKWTVNGNTLRIDLGEGGPDDSLVGTYTLNGKTLTYSYHWKDYYGKWEDDVTHTMTLERK